MSLSPPHSLPLACAPQSVVKIEHQTLWHHRRTVVVKPKEDEDLWFFKWAALRHYLHLRIDQEFIKIRTPADLFHLTVIDCDLRKRFNTSMSRCCLFQVKTVLVCYWFFPDFCCGSGFFSPSPRYPDLLQLAPEVLLALVNGFDWSPTGEKGAGWLSPSSHQPGNTGRNMLKT